MADVAGNLYSWSATAASNNPAGSTVIGAGLDDNLRQLQAVIRQDLSNTATDVASAATTDLGAVASNYVRITGTTTITAFGTVSAGIWKWVRFAGALTLTHNATSLILPTGGNITTVAGDMMLAISEGSGNWRVVSYSGVSAQHSTVTTSGNISMAATKLLYLDGGGDSYIVESSGNVIDIYAGANQRLQIASSYVQSLGLTFINDTANANMTTGLTINQGAADDEILSFKSSDIAHGITSISETDTFGALMKVTATGGGLMARGLGSAQYGIWLEATATTTNATRTTGADAPIILRGNLKSGTTIASVGADKNLLCIQDNGSTRFIFDSDGDSFQDVGTAWTNFDEHDDLLVMDAMALALNRKDALRETFVASFEEARGLLEQMPGKPIITFNEDGHHFANMSRVTMLHHGAIRQLGRGFNDHENRIQALTAENVALKAQLEARLQ